MKFRNKPVVIEATQWFKKGDHKEVIEHIGCTYRMCPVCGGDADVEPIFYIKTLEGNMYVTPGDWIITGIKGEYYPCKPDMFEQTYEKVEESSELIVGKEK